MADLQKTRLVRLLRSLSPQEMDKLEQYLTTHLESSQKRLLALFEFYISYYPHFNTPTLQKEEAFLQVYGEAYSSNGERKFNTLQSRLREEISLFIQLEAFKKNQIRRELFLLNYFADRRMELDFEYPLRRVEQLLDLKKIEGNKQKYSEELFYYKFLLEKIKNRWDGIWQSKEQEKVDNKAVRKSLNEFFVLQNLEYLCVQINSSRTEEIEEEIAFFLPFAYRVIDTCKDKETKLFMELFLSALTFLQQKEPSIAQYHQLKNRLVNLDLDKILSTNQRRNICTYLQNATRTLFRQTSKNQYFSELFELYQLQASYGVFDDFNLNPKLCINICTSALYLWQLDWLENFIGHREKHMLAFEDGSYFIFLAEVKFVQGDRTKAQKLLRQMDEVVVSTKVNHYNRVRRRRLEVKLGFLESNSEWILNQMASFRKYLTDHKKRLHEVFLEENRGFVKVINRLAKFNERLGEGEKIVKIKELEDFIDRLDHLVERSFLQGQLESLLPERIVDTLKTSRKKLIAGEMGGLLEMQNYLEKNEKDFSSGIMEANRNFLLSINLLQEKNNEILIELELKLTNEFFPVAERNWLLQKVRAQTQL